MRGVVLTGQDAKKRNKRLIILSFILVLFITFIFILEFHNNKKLKKEGIYTIGVIEKINIALPYQGNRNARVLHYVFTYRGKKYKAYHEVNSKNLRQGSLGSCDSIIFLPEKPHINSVKFNDRNPVDCNLQ